MNISEKLFELTKRIERLVGERYDTIGTYYVGITLVPDTSAHIEDTSSWFISAKLYECDPCDGYNHEVPTHKIWFKGYLGHDKQISNVVNYTISKALSSFENLIGTGLSSITRINYKQTKPNVAVGKLPVP